LILFSAKTAPGNSGGPLINEYGFVVGIVCQDLFYKDALIESGQLPYHTAIPAPTLCDFLNSECSGKSPMEGVS
jgi:S1-C subfamily serine protease